MTILDALKFNDLYQKLQNEQLPIATAYKLAKFNELISGTLKIYAEQLNLIIKKYAEIDVNGNLIQVDGGIKIKEEFLSVCQQELEELQNLASGDKIDITFNINELTPLKLTVAELAIFVPYIK